MATKVRERISVLIDYGVVEYASVQALAGEVTLTTLVGKALIKYLPKKQLLSGGE